VQTAETNELIDRYFGGSTDALVSSLLGSGRLTREEIERLRRLIGETK
jgi:predicted transcriptional regulator